jgi:hypothetical protein
LVAIPGVIVRVGLSASGPESTVHLGFLNVMDRGEARDDVVEKGHESRELFLLLLNVGQPRRADVSSGSIGLVVGLLVAFP